MRLSIASPKATEAFDGENMRLEAVNWIFSKLHVLGPRTVAVPAFRFGAGGRCGEQSTQEGGERSKQ